MAAGMQEIKVQFTFSPTASWPVGTLAVEGQQLFFEYYPSWLERNLEWSLAPAYDLTFADGPGGEHSITVAGEGRAPAYSHITELAGQYAIAGKELKKMFAEVPLPWNAGLNLLRLPVSERQSVQRFPVVYVLYDLSVKDKQDAARVRFFVHCTPVSYRIFLLCSS